MPAPLPTARFNHAALNCRHAPTSVAFYGRVLGFREVPRPGFDFNGAWLYREGLGMMLHLIEASQLDKPTGPINTRRQHLAFRVEDVDAAKSLLAEHGVACVEKRLPDYGYRQLFFHDPDGNVIELGEWPDVEQMDLGE